MLLLTELTYGLLAHAGYKDVPTVTTPVHMDSLNSGSQTPDRGVLLSQGDCYRFTYLALLCLDPTEGKYAANTLAVGEEYWCGPPLVVYRLYESSGIVH